MRALLALALLLCSTATAAAFDPVGLWRFHHTDGTIFYGRLYADQRATTDFGTGEVGIWRHEGESVRMVYTDGWDDLLHTVEGGFAKQSWAPGADRCALPSNENPAERLSADPDAPIPD